MGSTLTDPVVFGGGAGQAQASLRWQTVAHGYLGVVEGYLEPNTAAVWSTLTVALPCSVPGLTVDHRTAQGRPGVPCAGGHPLPAGHAEFDEQYLAAATDPRAAAALLTTEFCEVLLRKQVQRLSFEGSRLLVRSFDGFEASTEVELWLAGMAAAVLAATPAFVTRVTAGAQPQTFPRGLYGLDEPEDSRSGGRSSRLLFPSRKRAY